MVCKFTKGVGVKNFKEFLNIYLCVFPIDFRKGVYSLSSSIEESFGQSPFKGNSLFIFTNKNRKKIRSIYWDKTGFAYWGKTLEKEKFPWPKKLTQHKLEITTEQLEWILKGTDPWKIKKHQELNYKIL